MSRDPSAPSDPQGSRAGLRLAAGALLALGLSPLVGAGLGRAGWVDLARSSAAAPVAWEPVPNDRLLPHHGVQMWVQWRGADGRLTELALDAERLSRLSGPPARSSLVRLALTRVPELAADPSRAELLQALLEHLLCGERRLLAELGVPLEDVSGELALLFQATAGDHDARPPRVFEAPCPAEPEASR
jgi:hypothetical protein